LQRLSPRGANLTLTLVADRKSALTATISNAKNKPVKGWNKRPLATATGKKQKVLLKDIPTGGPYRLAIHDGKNSAVINHFYVGDVWLLAGQSNMEGCGNREGAAKQHPLIRAFSMRREWQQARDPLHIVPESPDHCHNAGRQWTLEESARHYKNHPKGVGPGI